MEMDVRIIINWREGSG